ncbi:response regulator [Natronoflexus pectinivorans]|uniref:DNA-binding NarL/FixJ family response regulator n=1 Tax=Natronoflexus pectinivorans TaxID=682526 RepID=A0A4R2GH54_9BACT|nr:response regulator transcription factor [Natronoflexus pectinivorans]TCO07107.1 DNA-binding NarL/FixJ family response regulator [Natronoflexus pectinivorans]
MKNDREKIKVFLVDDHTLFLNGLAMLLSSMPEMEIIGKAFNGKEFIEKLPDNMPDVVLMDIAMPEMDGIEATRRALEINPQLKIITLSMYDDQEYYTKMVQCGVNGFILKDSDIQEVRNAISTVADGGNYFSHELLRNLILTQKQKEHHSTTEDDLSGRELEILIEICQGLSNNDIAEKLFISKRTVEKHRANILLKTECKNTASLVVYAIKNQLIEI